MTSHEDPLARAYSYAIADLFVRPRLPGERLRSPRRRRRPPRAANWLPLADGDELVMVREYRHDPDTQRTSRLSVERMGSPGARSVPSDERAARAPKWSLDGVLGTMEITDLMRSSAFNAFPAADAEVRRPKYGNALYPTKDNVYEGLIATHASNARLNPGRKRARRNQRASCRRAHTRRPTGPGQRAQADAQHRC